MTAAPALRARAYGPGLPAEGVAVTCTATAFGPGLAADDPGLSIPGWSALSWRRGGFNDSQFFLEWRDDTGAGHSLVFDAAAEALLRPHLAGASRGGRPTGKATRRVSAGLMVALVGVPVALLVLLVALANPLLDWVVGQVPVDLEIRFGRQAFQQQKAALTLVDDHPALPMLRELTRQLTPGSPYSYEVHVARDPSVNAFAMPGGFVVFHTGLLEKAASAEEVAGVLAHEIQHVERRHGLRGLAHAAGWRVALSLVLGDAGGSVAAAWAENLGNLHFSRGQESEADALAVKRLLDKGIDPRGLARFFRTLMEQDASLPALLSSHPASEDRLAAIEAAVPAGRSFQALTWKPETFRGR